MVNWYTRPSSPKCTSLFETTHEKYLHITRNHTHYTLHNTIHKTKLTILNTQLHKCYKGIIVITYLIKQGQFECTNFKSRFIKLLGMMIMKNWRSKCTKPNHKQNGQRLQILDNQEHLVHYLNIINFQ